MELTRTYYPFTPPRTGLDVTVAAGDPVQFGTTALPFSADGELRVGQTRRFAQTFVLNIPGRSDVDVITPAPEPLPPRPDPMPPAPRPGDYEPPTETEMRGGGVTAVEGKERPE
jgi:hypothetical protein